VLDLKSDPTYSSVLKAYTQFEEENEEVLSSDYILNHSFSYIKNMKIIL